MTVAEVIREEVEAKGIKIISISKATGIPTDAISRSFLGKRKMLAEEMFKIAEYIGLSSDYIFEKVRRSKAG